MKTALIPVVQLLILPVLVSSFVNADTALAEESQNRSVGGDIVRAPAAASSNRVSRKRYPGGADEDDLQVQATLPLPSRTLDGTSSVTSPSGEDGVSTEGQSTSPAND